MGSQVSSDLVAATEKYQVYISGLAAWNPSSADEPYIEQTANVAVTALDEALATDYDGTLRFAPAWPSGWDASGTVYIQGGSKVDVQVEGGTLATAAIQAGTTQTMTVRNPWPGQQAEVVNGSSGAIVVAPTTASTLSVPVTAGQSYLVEQPSSPTTSLPFAQVTGYPGDHGQAPGQRVDRPERQRPPARRRRLHPRGARSAVRRRRFPARCRRPTMTPAGRGWPTTSPRSTAPPTATAPTASTWRPPPTPAPAADDLGWTAPGQWFKYTVNVATAGTYTVSLRLAAPNGVTDGLHIASSSGANLSGNVNVPATGGWQTWTTVTATVTLPAGQQTLTIDQDNGGWNIHQLTFARSSAEAPYGGTRGGGSGHGAGGQL